MPLTNKSRDGSPTAVSSAYRSSVQRKLPPLKQQQSQHQQHHSKQHHPQATGSHKIGNHDNQSDNHSSTVGRTGQQYNHLLRVNSTSPYHLAHNGGNVSYLGITSSQSPPPGTGVAPSSASAMRGRRASPRMKSNQQQNHRVSLARSTSHNAASDLAITGHNPSQTPSADTEWDDDWDSRIDLRRDLSPEVVHKYLRQYPEVLDQYVASSVPTDRIERWLQKKTHPHHRALHSKSHVASNGENTSGRSLVLARWKSNLQASKGKVLQELSKDFYNTNGKIMVLLELASCAATAISADAYTLCSCDSEKQELTHIYKNENGEVVFGARERVGLGTSVAASVAFTKEAIRIKELLGERRYPDGLSVSNNKAHCVMCLPIVDEEDTCFGVVEFFRQAKQSSFTEEEEEIASLLLVIGTTALANYETHSTMMRQRTLSDFLLEVTKSIFQDIVSMDVVIMKIMKFAQRLVNADRASLFLVDYANRELYARIFDVGQNQPNGVGSRPSKQHQEIRFSMDKGVAGYVATTGKVLNIVDAYKDKRFNPEVDIRTGYKTKSILCMPIFIRGVVIGVVQMVNKINGTFTKTDEEAFETFAIYCGLALHHAKLYEKIRRSEQKYKVALDVLSYHNKATVEEVNALKAKRIPFTIPGITKYNFSPWSVLDDEKPLYCLYMFRALFSNMKFDLEDLMRFTLTVRKNYRNVPYHNWTHAFSVAHSMFTLIESANHDLTPVESISLFVSCLCHDLDHRGKTNQFMVQSASPLASIYSTSTMEHHHFNQTVTILQNEGHNIFKYLSSEEYKKVLHDIKQSILATDLAVFFKNKVELEAILSKESFSWSTVHHRNTLTAIMMTACDLCAMFKPWDVQQELVYIIMEEFWQQGDEEKKRGLTPVQMMDRDKQDDLPNLEVGFIQSICVPCYELMFQVMPDTKPMLDGSKPVSVTDFNRKNGKKKPKPYELPDRLQKANLKRWKELADDLERKRGTQV